MNELIDGESFEETARFSGRVGGFDLAWSPACWFVGLEVSLRPLDGRGVNGLDRVRSCDPRESGFCDHIG
jgi:hypothetical protein